MRFIGPIKSGFVVFGILAAELITFILIGEGLGDVFQWIYRSIWALIPYVILSLIFYVFALVIFFRRLAGTATQPLQFTITSLIAPFIALLPFWLAWLRAPLDETEISLSWIFATIIIAISLLIPFWIGSMNLRSRWADNKALEATSARVD